MTLEEGKMVCMKAIPLDEGDRTVKHVPQPDEQTRPISVDVQYLSEDTRPVDNVIYAYAPVQAEPVREQPQARQETVMLNFGAAALQAA